MIGFCYFVFGDNRSPGTVHEGPYSFIKRDSTNCALLSVYSTISIVIQICVSLRIVFAICIFQI